MKKASLSRRSFLARSGKGALGGALLATTGPAARARAARVSPNEKVNLAVIGTGGMGGRHVEALAENKECNLVALCDVAKGRYFPNLDKVEQMTGKRPDGYQDFRYVLEREDVDAILVATPDHWHPLLTILGCQAGKDVYVEKPACPTVAEGRAMVETARRYGRVVQLGTQQRNMEVFQKAMEIIHSGQLGRITTASAWVDVNGWGVGMTPAPVPRGLDWDLWLGPSPKEPFSMERYGGFMGCHDYARGGQLTNWGVHLMDIVHWGIGQDRCLSVQATGGNYRHHAGTDNYENVEAIFEFPGCTVTWEQRHKNTHANKGYGVSFFGEKGSLFVDRGTVVVRPDSLGIKEFVGEPEKSWAHPPHHLDFFNSIRTRQKPAADIEQGVRSTTTVLLAGIALKTRRRLEWDGEKECFINDPEADRYLWREYRPPWHL